MAKTVSDIKRAQKESLLLRELSTYFLHIILDEKRFQDVVLNRVKLSKDKSVCTLFFYSLKGKPYFQEILPHLISYKPSMRKALAQSINARYTPELIFTYDTSFEKQLEVDDILNKLKQTEEL